MKTYSVQYYLGDMHHTYLVDAKNEYEATTKVLKSIPDTSQERFHNLTIKRYFQEWN